MALSAKEEYIAQCMTTGKTREECEQLWNQSQKPPTDQQTKEEYITQCMASGKTKEECEQAWAEAHQTADYATLAKRLELEKAKNDELKMYLKQATKLLQHFQERENARDIAAKHKLAMAIEETTNRRFRYGDLMNKPLESLEEMKLAIDSAAKSHNFVSVAHMLEEADRRREPVLTVGEYDPITKKWKGGR